MTKLTKKFSANYDFMQIVNKITKMRKKPLYLPIGIWHIQWH